MENFSKYTPLAIYEREMVLYRVLGIDRMRKRWKLINYSPNSQISLL